MDCVKNATGVLKERGRTVQVLGIIAFAAILSVGFALRPFGMPLLLAAGAGVILLVVLLIKGRMISVRGTDGCNSVSNESVILRAGRWAGSVFVGSLLLQSLGQVTLLFFFEESRVFSGRTAAAVVGSSAVILMSGLALWSIFPRKNGGGIRTRTLLIVFAAAAVWVLLNLLLRRNDILIRVGEAGLSEKAGVEMAERDFGRGTRRILLVGDFAASAPGVPDGGAMRRCLGDIAVDAQLTGPGGLGRASFARGYNQTMASLICR
jgi:hypothetical protein